MSYSLLRRRSIVRRWNVQALEDRLVPATLLHSLFPSTNEPQAGGQFGAIIATSADYRVVASPVADALGNLDDGQVNIYSATTNALLYTLNNPTSAASDRFGISVGVAGKYVVVGADGDDAGASASGAAYLYDLTSATPTVPVQTWLNPVPTALDQFGLSVGITNNYVVIASPFDDESAMNSGSIYIYDIGFGLPSAPFATIKNPTPGISDNFGMSVAISGKYVVAGAHQDDTGATDAGSAYVFDVSSATPATPVVTMNNPSPAVTDNFGRVVAISGNQVVVSAYLDDFGASNSGSAYIYNLASGTPSIPAFTLANPAPAANDQFGFGLATNGKYVVVGANLDDTNVSDGGSAYVFDTTSVTPTVPAFTLNNPFPAASDQFGNALAITGNVITVGAAQDDTTVANVGSVYVYDLTGVPPTTPTSTIDSPYLPSFDNFGISVAVDGKYVIVGSPLDDTGAGQAGQVYVYDLTSATPAVPVLFINNPAPASNDQFGSSVAISGKYVAVGSYFDDQAGTNTGTIYAYDLSSPTPTVPIATMPNPSPGADDAFGVFVSISGPRIAIGASNDDTGATDSGAAYVFDVTSPTTHLPVFTFPNPSVAAGDNFGSMCTIDGNIVAISAANDDLPGLNAGVVYVYDLNSATPTIPIHTIHNPTPSDGDGFGTVSLSGKYLAVGAVQDDVGATDAGSAYIYDLKSATPTVPYLTLNNPAPAMTDTFGLGISISGKYVLIGASGDDAISTNGGTAYLYDITTGTPTVPIDTLHNPTPLNDEAFARSVSISGNTMVVGTFQDSTQNFWSGGAYVYVQPGTKVSKIEVNDGASVQRSRVTSVTVTFDAVVTFAGNPADAFQLKRQGNDAPVTLSATPAGNTVTLTFTGGSVDNISLADGLYTLTILKSQINGGSFDSTGSSVPGDNYVLVGTLSNRFFRLFGDADGNATVNASDFAAFRAVFGLSGPSPFDFNGDNQTNATDFAQFRARFGLTLMP